VIGAVAEVDAGAAHQVHDRASHKHLTRLSQCFDPLGDMDSKSGNILTSQLDFAGVYTGPYLQSY